MELGKERVVAGYWEREFEGRSGLGSEEWDQALSTSEYATVATYWYCSIVTIRAEILDRQTNCGGLEVYISFAAC